MLAKWHSIPNNDGLIKGPNDSGICTFSGFAIKSLVRETIQNALDAEKIDENKPTVVEFCDFRIPVEKFPGIEEFKVIIDKCLENKEDNDIQDIFGNAKRCLGNDIRVLRISDFNTCGLIGADDGRKGTKWSRLVKELGTANNNQGSQGSFGIGKAAPFVCSELRTVFYSSLDKNGIKSNIGVGRLVSFKESDGELTTGDIFWSDSNKKTAIMKLADIDDNFIRNSCGTDIYVMGMREESDLGFEIKRAVLENFLVSIWSDKLEVNICGEKINKQNLGSHIEFIYNKIKNSNYNKIDEEKIEDLNNYYMLLENESGNCHTISIKAEDYGSEFGFADDEAVLLIMEAENLNRRILMTRGAGMKLFEQKNINGSASFTGILLMTGPNMNREFRKMEVASHDKWIPDSCKNPKDRNRLNKMYVDLRKYLRGQVNSILEKSISEINDAYGVSAFLPSDNTNDLDGKQLEEKIVGLVKVSGEKHNKSTKTKVRNKKEKEQMEFVDGEQGNGINVSTTRGSGKHGHTKGTKLPRIQGEMEIGFREEETHVNQRVVCINSAQGIYMYIFTAPSNKKEKLEFFVNGEQYDAKLSILEIEAIDDTTKIICGEENKVILSGVRKNMIVKLRFKISFERYCKWEVKHYEAKK